MPTYKLIYFDLSALGETPRMLMVYGKIPFTDDRIVKANWPALKPKMPFGVMPVLEVDGKQLPQSMAINRYLANLVGLVGKDVWENALIDAAADTITDIRLKLVVYSFEKEPTKKAELKKQLETEVLPFFLSRLDAQAKDNNGYLANGKLSWADFYLAGMHDFLNLMIGKNIFEEYVNLLQVYKNVLSIPHVKSYVDARPKDKF